MKTNADMNGELPNGHKGSDPNVTGSLFSDRNNVLLQNFTYDNASAVYNVAHKFFEIYYAPPRFIAETLMAFVAIVANIFVMFLLVKGSTKQKGTAYRMLFYNLSAANALCCLLSWMANNSLLIFEHQFVDIIKRPEGLCRVFLCLVAAMFVSVAFGTESCVTMLGFTAVQYRSVSRPLVHWAMTRQKMAYVFLVASWVLTFLFGCVPFGLLLTMSNSNTCTEELREYALKVVIVCATIAIAIESITYIIVIVLSALVYVKLRHYGQGFWNIRFDSQIKGQKRTFATTLMLFITLVIFSMPYMILYIVTLTETNISNIHQSALVHYMTLLPYLKFLTDPVIYGLRMREVREGWYKIMVKCGLERCAGSSEQASLPRTPPPFLMDHMHFLR